MKRQLSVIASLSMMFAATACGSGLDGSETRAACNDYITAAMACWDEAQGDHGLVGDECDDINADVHHTALPEESDNGQVLTLAEVYTCYADAYIELKADDGCGTPEEASEVDLESCDFVQD